MMKSLPLVQRKPASTWWVRVHPDPAYSVNTMVIEFASGKTWLVVPKLWLRLEGLQHDCQEHLFRLAIARHTQRLFLWHLDPPQPSWGWGQSARDAAKLAEQYWVRLQANHKRMAYDVWREKTPTVQTWPEMPPMDTLLRSAFRSRIITTLDHPVLQYLRGELWPVPPAVQRALAPRTPRRFRGRW